MTRLLREPLVHFLVLGALLFAVGEGRGDLEPRVNRIAITPGVVERLVEAFRLTWQRPPTEDELRGLLAEHLKEEVLYREALEMGLDRGDQIIRRRLRQKLEFIAADVVESFEPTDLDLRTYLDEHADRYRRPTVLGLTQIYLRIDPDADTATTRAHRLLARLRSGPETDPRSLGDPFLHPAVLPDISAPQLARVFGTEFSSAVIDLPVGAWSGPIPSAFGIHLVRLDSIDPARPAALDEVRDAVHRDLVSERTREAEQRYYEGLLAQYTVTVEWPEGMDPIDVPEAGR